MLNKILKQLKDDLNRITMHNSVELDRITGKIVFVLRKAVNDNEHYFNELNSIKPFGYDRTKNE